MRILNGSIFSTVLIHDPAPRRRQAGLVFERVGIAFDQLIPDHSRREDAFAAGVEIGVRNVEWLIPRDIESVVLLAGKRRRPQQRRAQSNQRAQTGNLCAHGMSPVGLPRSRPWNLRMFSARMCAMVSDGPPAANGTIIVI